MNYLTLFTILTAVHSCYTFTWPSFDRLVEGEVAHLAQVKADPHAAGKVVQVFDDIKI